MIRYVVHPNVFRDARSSQLFRVTAQDIIRAEDLPPEQCLIYTPGTPIPEGVKHIRVTPADLPRYFPDEFEDKHAKEREAAGDDEFHGW